jgi:hypothetical protein
VGNRTTASSTRLIIIIFSSLLCAVLRAEVGALELDVGTVWDHWIGWGMARTGVCGSMKYYTMIEIV